MFLDADNNVCVFFIFQLSHAQLAQLTHAANQNATYVFLVTIIFGIKFGGQAPKPLIPTAYGHYSSAVADFLDHRVRTYLNCRSIRYCAALVV